jgi:hypothetical protein
MAEFVAYTLDGKASKTWVRPIALITSIEVREDRLLVIYFVQGNPVLVQCGSQAEQLAREIMGGLATTPPLKQGNRLITSIEEVVVEPTQSRQASQSGYPSSVPAATTAASRSRSLMP